MTPNANTKGNILLVDDDQFLVDLYATKFARAGYAVHSSLSADAALGALRNGFDADLILFDIVMPEIDGFSFLHTLLDEHLAPNTPLIALTNQSSPADKAKAEQLGACAYIVKALMSPKEVVAVVDQMIALKSGARSTPNSALPRRA